MKSAVASSDLDALPAIKVLLRARAEGRLPHAVLLTGPDPDLLCAVAERLAAMHLEVADPIAHPDCRVVRPAKKSRRIPVASIPTTSPCSAASRIHRSASAFRRSSPSS